MHTHAHAHRERRVSTTVKTLEPMKRHKTTDRQTDRQTERASAKVISSIHT